jgi:hypothetical protein
MLLDTTNDKVYLTGKPVVRERFDEIGRRLAHDGPTTIRKQYCSLLVRSEQN